MGRKYRPIFDVPLLEVNNQNITDLIDEILTIESANVKLHEAEKELLNSPIFKDLILSEDRSTTGILINFKKDFEHEFLIKEKDRLNSLEILSKEDKVKLKNIIFMRKVRNYDRTRHKNINEIRAIIE